MNMIFKSTYEKRKKANGFLTGIVVGGIIFGGIGASAVTLSAEQVKYTPSNENFIVTNVKEAMDEIYKIAEYEIPADTYFYDSDTEGKNIVRYRKVDGKFYECNENGKVEDNALEVDVSEKNLIEYTSLKTNNLIAWNAGYADKSLYLGDGVNNGAKIIATTYPIYYRGDSTNTWGNPEWIVDENFCELSDGVITYKGNGATAYVDAIRWGNGGQTRVLINGEQVYYEYGGYADGSVTFQLNKGDTIQVQGNSNSNHQTWLIAHIVEND